MTWVVAIVVGLIVGLIAYSATDYRSSGLVFLGGLLGGILGYYFFDVLGHLRIFSSLGLGGIYLDVILWSLVGSLILAYTVQALLPGRTTMMSERGVAHEVPRHRRVKKIIEEEDDAHKHDDVDDDMDE